MRHKAIFSNILSILFLCLFGVYFVTNINDFKTILNISPLYLLIITFLQLSVIFLNGMFISLLAIPFQKFISVKESFHISLITTIGNYFAPLKGGFGARAVYLKTKHKLPYSEFLVTLYGNYVIVFLLSALFGLLSLALIYLNLKIISYPLLITFLGIFIIMMVLILINPITFQKYLRKFTHKISAISTIIANVINGWNKLIVHKSLIRKLALLSILNFITSALVYYFEFLSLGFQFRLGELMLYTALVSLSIIISITPGAIGIREAVLMTSSSTIGITKNQVLLVALIDRSVLFVILLVASLVLAVTKKQSRKIDL